MISTLALKSCNQNLYNQKFLIRKEFKFKKLPVIVRMLIIQLMDPAERFVLSFTSKRMEIELMLARRQSYEPVLNFYDGYSLIELEEDNGLNIRCCGEELKIDEMRLYSKHGTIVENTAEAFHRLQNTTKCRKIHFVLHVARIELSFLVELFSNFELESWSKLSLVGREIEAESVNFVLNTPTFDKHFWFLNANMPVDFRHVNAFKFRSNDYEDARWVRMEDLLEMKNVENVSLNKTIFTSSDIQNYITHWINSENDLFEYMHIGTDRDIELGGVLDDLVVLEHLNEPGSIFFVLAKCPSRAYPLLAISCAFNLVVLSAWRQEEVFNSRYGEGFQMYENTYKKLEVLEKKNTLERKMELEETDSAERKKMSKELEVLNEKISRLGVYFHNGRAVTN
ncbi:hypothetical protein GCK72_003784 [Caenorhabditis remanei]|uniref:Sdz-33 F-box domain-containing protein n=1 Tax=Caenorhabditis remanei TaxID=31234 RepID=A0A6A5H7X4_CAERE|nr:hypothetical protein GCK72_003784 [Caenorhabditis remanei]KAF1763838.1 hypothetical protein GCK72_003784 [Caenorhabditis remanei]